MTARKATVESFQSWEYDEVTDVSEGSRSLQQIPHSTHERNSSLVPTVPPRKTGELLERTLITLQETSEKKFIFSSVAASALKLVNMAAEEEDSFNQGLEEKDGSVTRSAFHDGHLEPSSTSGGDSGSINGGLQRAPRDGGGMESSLENKNDDFRPGPSHAPPPPHLAPTSPLHQDHPSYHMGGSQGDETDEDGMGKPDDLAEMGGLGGPGQPMPLAHPAGMPGDDDDDDDEDDDDDDDEDDDGHAPAPEGAYDPSDYEHLSVNPEIAELFSYITRYTPQAIELEHRLRPYIPDYIPAVGDIDAFIKIPPPDGKPSLVGLEVLDEPSAHQSDATVLDLQLRALAKHTTAKSLSVKTVENAEKNGKVIEKWVRDISELHRTKPPPTVHYSKRMPDIDTLMQEWPGEVEELLKEINLPTAALQVELSAYVDIICAALDIPVYKNRIQSLHVLFTLYSVFKNSAHFRQLAEENYIENDDSAAERLVIT